MISNKVSPSVLMGEIASCPGKHRIVDLAENYAVSKSTVRRQLNISNDRGWLKGIPFRDGGNGAPKKLFKPADLFWRDFAKVNDSLHSHLTNAEQDLLTEATRAGSIANYTAQAPDNIEHRQARATLLGNAALLSERYTLVLEHWFKDSQAMLSLIAINASLIDPLAGSAL